jgi:hypothetical protein
VQPHGIDAVGAEDRHRASFNTTIEDTVPGDALAHGVLVQPTPTEIAMPKTSTILCLGWIAAALAAWPALAQSTPPATTNADEPEQKSLTVGALQVGSANNLQVEGFDINAGIDSVAYSYFLKNTGPQALTLTAAVSLPELQASADRSEIWKLAANDPENPIGLAITVADTAVTTRTEVHAYALGIDRLSEIRAAHLPLIPFGPEIDKALGGLSADAADRLASFGIISVRDPEHPQEPMTADWSLDVVRSWSLALPPHKTTAIVVKFTPVVARYTEAKGDEDDIDDLRDDICLSPQTLNTLKARLKGNGSWKATDMSLAADAPAHWIDSPNPSVTVRKPGPRAIVAFCGMDEKTAGQSTVLGTVAEGNDTIRIVIFEPARK